MRVEVRAFVSDRTLDGRVYSANTGAVHVIDDDDEGMVELMRRLQRRGLVTISRAAPAVRDGSGYVDRDELQMLRGRAEALGVRVDGRWKAERLRTEIERVRTEIETEGRPTVADSEGERVI